jgi:hypothetical protein
LTLSTTLAWVSHRLVEGHADAGVDDPGLVEEPDRGGNAGGALVRVVVRGHVGDIESEGVLPERQDGAADAEGQRRPAVVRDELARGDDRAFDIGDGQVGA